MKRIVWVAIVLFLSVSGGYCADTGSPAEVAQSSAAAPLDRGKLFLDRENYQEALTLFNQAAVENPENPQVYYLRAVCHKHLKNYTRARKDLHQAMTLEPAAAFLAERADLELTAGHHQIALLYLDRALAEDPENDLIYQLQGKAYDRAGETEKAVTAYHKAVKLNPANKDARTALVRLYAGDKKDTASALTQIQEYRASRPGDPFTDDLKRELLKAAPNAQIPETLGRDSRPALPSADTSTAGAQGTRAAAGADEAVTATRQTVVGKTPAVTAAAKTPVGSAREAAGRNSDASSRGEEESVTVDSIDLSVDNFRPPDGKELQAAFAELPPLPPLSSMLAQAKATPVAPRLDPGEFSQLQYKGAVSAVKKAMEELAGPMSPAARDKFKKQWAALYDYPADACVEYLNGASPLLGEILSLRASMMKVMQGYDNLINQAQMARFFRNHTAAHDLMRRAGQNAALLKALRRRFTQATQSLAALGELPDAALIKARVAEQFAAAKSLLRNLNRPLDLSGEYEPASFLAIQDPYDRGRRSRKSAPDDTVIITENDSDYDYDEIIYFQPLKSLGENLVLMYLCETDADGDKDSWLAIFENQGSGVFVTYGGGSDLTKIVIRLTEDGFEKTEYSIEPKEYYDDINDFSEMAAELITKGKLPEMKLTRDIRTRNFYANYVQYQKPPTDDDFDWNRWEDQFRSNAKDFLEEFQRERLAFETLAPKVNFPQPVPAEHVFWVFERMETVNKRPTLVNSGAFTFNPKAKAVYMEVMKRKDGFEPWPAMKTSRRNDVSKAGIVHVAERTVYDNADNEKKVYDGMNVTHEVTWGAPPPVIAQAGGFFRLEVAVKREATAPAQPVLAADFNPVNFSLTPNAVKADGEYKGHGGDSTNLTLLSKQQNSGPGEVSEKGTIQVRLHELASEHAMIELSCSLGGSSARYFYRRQIMTPAAAEELAAGMGGDLETLVAEAKSSQKTRVEKTEAAVQQAREQQQALEESLEFHQTTIAYEQKRAEHYQQDLDAELQAIKKSGQPPTQEQEKRIAALRFNIINAHSNAIAEQDRINELQTGTYQRSETPFDSMARIQFRRNIEKNIRKIEAVETQNALAEKYIEFLPPGDRGQALKTLQKIRDEAPDDIERYLKLNQALKSKWHGATEAKMARIDEDLAWKETQVNMVENIKTGADVGMMACSMMGGPQAIALTYQFATGWAEKDILQGVKQSLTLYSDAVDIAWSTYDGYCQGGWEGATKAGGMSLMMNKGLPFLLGKMSKGGDLPDAGAAKSVDNLSTAAKKADGATPLLKAGKPKIDDVKQYEAELRQAETQVKSFVSDYHAWRKGVKEGLPDAEIARLHKKVVQATASINGNPTAKGFLKYKAQPAVGRIFSKSLDDIHAQARNTYYETMKKAGYSDHEIFAIRNASSSGSTGMDFDQALKEQPDFIPVRNKDGSVTLRRNVWLTKNGKPVSRHQWQMDAQKAWGDAYKNTTDGFSAPRAWEKMTSKADPEAYRMMAVLNIHKDLSNVDEIMDSLDPKWVRQMSDVTMFKAGEMLKDPNLSRLARVREACRGTAKDLDGKFLPFINAKLNQLKKISPAKLTPADQHNIKRLESALERFTKVKNSFDAIGKADIPPGQWDDAINLSTGGKGIMDTILDLSDLTQSLF